MSNEERIEEMVWQAHQAGDVDKLHEMVEKYQLSHPNKRLIDIYEMAHFHLKTNRLIKR